MRRRSALLLAPWLAGCAAGLQPPDVMPPIQPSAGGTYRPWRTLDGGFLGRTSPALGVPAAPGTGMYTRFVAPVALALHGHELLVADAGSGRLWRVDVLLDTMAGIAGAAVSPQTVLALGHDGSAYLLDPPTRRIARFARDGRLIQAWSVPLAIATPVALALADGGATVLLGDGMGARWVEMRGGPGLPMALTPHRADGRPVSGTDALGVWRDTVYVLDRLAGAVHHCRRDGSALATLGQGRLQQPSRLAVDGVGRACVLDAHDGRLHLLAPDGSAQVLDTRAAGAAQAAAVAADGDLLAIADRASGRVVLWRSGPGTLP